MGESMATTELQKDNDLFHCDGPIERADGVRPFNYNLWPLPGDDWWACYDLGDHCIDPRWHFSVFALADGRYSTSSSVFDIERGVDSQGRVCVFSTREKAVRMSCARMIRTARASRKWQVSGCGKLEGSSLSKVINYALMVVSQETGKPVPRPVKVKEPDPPKIKTGLPLFDFP